MPIITPARPPAAYIGGKRNLAKRLCAHIAATPHRAYIEPFVGMGGVFLRRPERAQVEVINDLSGDVANLFRVIRRHHGPFIDELDFLIASRAEFERQRVLDPLLLTDIERAVRFLYIQRLAFGGRVKQRNFGVRRNQHSAFDITRLRADLLALRDRLASVTIEQLGFADLIRRYDGAQVLFYLDPPYDGTEGYGIPFDRAQYTALAEQLTGIAGQFILSINDTPFIRETFAHFRIEEVATSWTVSSASTGRATKVTELIIRSPAR